jgi:quercetin dioxygenase-like cupin family protein
MSSMHRTISGDILVQHLEADAMLIDAALVARHGRSARTLVKEGALRLTIMALAPGGVVPVHSTDNPVSIQVLDGDVDFYALDQKYELSAGDVLVFAASVEHAARSVHGSTFLLTVAHVARSDEVHRVHCLSDALRRRWTKDGG